MFELFLAQTARWYCAWEPVKSTEKHMATSENHHEKRKGSYENRHENRMATNENRHEKRMAIYEITMKITRQIMISQVMKSHRQFW